MRAWLPAPRRAVVAVVVAGLITAIAWQTGGGFFTIQDVSGERNLTVARILMFVVLSVVLYALPDVVRSSRTAARIAFAAWAVYLGAWLVAVWPGAMMTDTIELVRQSRDGVVFDWFSWLFSAFNVGLLDLVPHIAALGVLQVVMTAATMAYATQALLAWRRNVPAAVAMNVIAALSLPFVINAVMLTRDTLFTLGHVVLAIAVAQVVTRQRPPSVARIGWIAALTGVLSVARGDGIVLLLVVPLLLLTLRPARRALLGGALAFVVSALLFNVALPAAFSVHDDSRAYSVALRMNLLGAVFQTDWYSVDRERDLRELGRVVDVDAVREMYDAVEVPAFWAGRWNRNASDEDFEAYEAAANRIVLENLPAVLAGRLQTFGASTGLATGQMTISMGEPDTRFTGLPAEDRRGISAELPSEGLYEGAKDLVEYTVRFTGSISTRSALFWNFLPWLALLLVTLAFWRRLPFVATISLVVLSRVPLVFAAAPAAHFKYYLSVQLGGIVVLGLLLALVRREDLRRIARRPRPRGTSAAMAPRAAR